MAAAWLTRAEWVRRWSGGSVYRLCSRCVLRKQREHSKLLTHWHGAPYWRPRGQRVVVCAKCWGHTITVNTSSARQQQTIPTARRIVQLQQEVSPHISCTWNRPFSHPVHHFTPVSMWDTDVYSSIALSFHPLFSCRKRVGGRHSYANALFSTSALKMFHNTCVLFPERKKISVKDSHCFEHQCVWQQSFS